MLRAWWLLLALLLAGCPRALPEGVPVAGPRGTDPWDSPSYHGIEQAIIDEARARRAPEPVPEVQLDAGRGPELPAVDTFDEALIPGQYLVVAMVFNEKMDLLPPSDQSIMDFKDRGRFTYTLMQNWEPQLVDGGWRKLRPGAIALQLGIEEPSEMQGQFLEGQFLYLWNGPDRRGMWLVRIPEQSTQRIEHNHFQTSRGELRINEVVATSFSGRVTGRSDMTVSGFYNRGVLTLRWEQDDRTAVGYAALVVSPDWEELHGYWWIDDWEAAPFGDRWTGTAIR